MKLLIFLFFIPIQLFSQNTIGFPEIINYSKQLYSAGLQNWDIKQDRNGIIYMANNEGLLSFDGSYWNLFPLPNKTIVRSVEIGKDKRIYVGGQDELGYFEPSENGNLNYHSLTGLLEANNKLFDDVWDIISINNDVFFRTNRQIFKLTNNIIVTYNAASEWSFMGMNDGTLFAHDYQFGLMKFANKVWSPVSDKNILPANDPVTSILSIRNDSALITTLKNGLFLLTNKAVTKLTTSNDQLFTNNRIYAATKINADWYAFATSNNGLYITDIRGNIIQHFSRTEGLQNNNVLSIFLDNQQNLWLGLDNGIDLITYNSAIKQIKPKLQEASGYTSIIFDNKLYLGTSNGLFSILLQNMKDLSFSKGLFTEVNNAKGQTWGLANINNRLLLGQHEGAFVVENNMAKPISASRGFWNFTPLSNIFPSAQIVSGNYNGLTIFDFVNGSFGNPRTIPGFTESSRFVTIDADKNIWVSHPYHGLFRNVLNANGQYKDYSYSVNNGLPSTLNNHIYNIKNELVVATEKGIYVYNSAKDMFEPSAYYQKLLGNQSIRYLKEDIRGNIWFIHEKTLGVIDYSKKVPEIIYLPELNNKMLSGFEFIYPLNDNNIFLGAEKGFYHINYEKYKQTIPQLNVHISSLKIIQQTDSLLFGGYFKNEKQIQEDNEIPAINYKWKTLRFEYASAMFGYQPNLEYSYRLKGYNSNWSEWTKRTEKEYSNLSSGKFTFEVKVRNNLGKESAVTAYIFKILPPWYDTNWAKSLYLLLFAGAMYYLYRLQEKKFKVQKRKYEIEQKKAKYIYELELSKTESELVALRNEKLESDIQFKNSELASSAMHLVKKSELVSKMKTELTHVMKGIVNPQAETELKKMIRSIGEDDNLDNEWENFTKHFDKVHSDFIIDLKEKHPDVSNNEVKLCAYLRMNLSTKEIAQLMNISVRGVEVSRYRLRKKLGLTTETNLFDYLIGIQTKS